VPDLHAGSPGLLLFAEIFFEDSRADPLTRLSRDCGIAALRLRSMPSLRLPSEPVSKVEPRAKAHLPKKV
jgi:hypothetical protein